VLERRYARWLGGQMATADTGMGFEVIEWLTEEALIGLELANDPTFVQSQSSLR
jgi:hypothetical protein